MTKQVAKAGDLIGFSSFSLLDMGINLATRGIPFYHISHVGIVANSIRHVIFESSMKINTDCIIQKKRVKGVQAHFLTDRIREYKGKVWLYPLARSLSMKEQYTLQNYLEGQLGISYDTLGAFRSRDLSLIEKIMFRKPDLHSLFCSELCAQAYKQLGIFGAKLNPGKLNPNKLVRLGKKAGFLGKAVRLKVI